MHTSASWGFVMRKNALNVCYACNLKFSMMWCRLTAREETLLMPLDMEVSLRELKEVLNSSKRAHRQVSLASTLGSLKTFLSVCDFVSVVGTWVCGSGKHNSSHQR